MDTPDPRATGMGGCKTISSVEACGVVSELLLNDTTHTHTRARARERTHVYTITNLSLIHI